MMDVPMDVPETAIADLRRRVRDTSWPDRETVGDPSWGAQLAPIRELVRYWSAMGNQIHSFAKENDHV
jgi:hypothetical protein